MRDVKADTTVLRDDTSAIKQDTSQILAQIALLRSQLPYGREAGDENDGKHIQLERVPTEENLADILTKSLSHKRFNQLLDQLEFIRDDQAEKNVSPSRSEDGSPPPEGASTSIALPGGF